MCRKFNPFVNSSVLIIHIECIIIEISENEDVNLKRGDAKKIKNKKRGCRIPLNNDSLTEPVITLSVSEETIHGKNNMKESECKNL